MEKPNIFLIVVDTLRADHLRCYGYARKTSPNMDRLAEKGALFQNFFASGMPTFPGWTTILTEIASKIVEFSS